MNREPRTRLGTEQLLTTYYGLEVKNHTAYFSGKVRTSVPQFPQL